MNHAFNLFKTLVAAIGTAVSFFLGDWDTALIVLMAFMALDYVTGVIVAYANKTVNSEVGFKGLAKKFFILIILIAAVCLDRLLSNGSWVFRTWVCYFYIANEGISLLENAGNLGLPVPGKLKTALEQLNDDDKDREGKGDNAI